jgi:hypothetical protein
MKKAFELSVLCNCDIGLIMFSNNDKCYQYASTSMDQILVRYTENQIPPFESKTNADIAKKLEEENSEDGDGVSPTSTMPSTMVSPDQGANLMWAALQQVRRRH